MSTNYGNIDDVLNSAQTNSQTPETPEHDHVESENTTNSNSDYDTDEVDESVNEGQALNEDAEDDGSEDATDVDDYGNEKAKPKTYTEEEVNDRINKAVRERLARGGQQQPSEPALQKQTDDFQYNPDSQDTWQQQLELFVEQTVSKMSQKQVARQQKQHEDAVEAQFVDKFTNGMEKFRDFREVVGSQPITDDMTRALRGIADPAAFIYAASKRHPQELSRISKIPDKYAQMVEIGKLEERMRKNSTTTKAPRPVSRTLEDAGMPGGDKKKSEPSIEDLIAKSDARKLAQVKQRRAR